MPERKFLPGVPLPLPLALQLSKPLLGLAESLVVFLPYLKLNLQQAEIELDPREFLAVGVFASLLYFLASGFIIFTFSYVMTGEVILWLPVVVALLSGGGALFYHLAAPHLIVQRKVKEIEKNLLFSMRSLMVQVSSGVPLYTALTTIARSGYGKVSDEFAKAVDKMATGTPQDVALGKITLGNPSVFFRRAIWQITNGMRSGSNISEVLDSVTENLAREQSIQIKRYGSQLNPLALVYMIVSVIVPALGMTFVIVLSSFPSLPIHEYMLWAFLGLLAVAQFMLLGLIKSRRPNLLG